MLQRSMLFLLLSALQLVNADITWPLYSQQCEDDAGSRYVDDEQNYPNGKYHDNSAAIPVLQPDGSCAKPMQDACNKRPDPKTAYLEGPIDCGDNGWYCRIIPDENWPPINLMGDLNFGHCNTTDGFEDAGYDRDGHCHGSASDSTYYWWVRDHWFRQYNGRLRCCCGWYEGSSEPLYGRRITNRCDYRRLVTAEEDVNECRDANEDHNLGFDDIGCDTTFEDQIGSPIPENDDICWEVSRFGFSESGEQLDDDTVVDNDDGTESEEDDDETEEGDDETEEDDDEEEEPEEDDDEESEEGDDEEEEPEEDDDEGVCADVTNRFNVIRPDGTEIMRSCLWVQVKPSYRCSWEGVSSNCPATCGTCESSAEDDDKELEEEADDDEEEEEPNDDDEEFEEEEEDGDEEEEEPDDDDEYEEEEEEDDDEEEEPEDDDEEEEEEEDDDEEEE